MAPQQSLISKLKVQLKLSISRLRMVQQKDTAIAKQQRRAMAQLLEIGKEQSARIRVENIIQSDIHTELLEILELYCELLLARTGLMEAKECDPGLEEAVKSVIYAAPRIEIKELHQVRLLLVEKYGKEFSMDAANNKDDKVSERVIKKLRIDPPSAELVTLYLTEIARAYDIPWPKGETKSTGDDDESNGNDDPSSGGQKAKQDLEEPLKTNEQLSRATPPRDLGPRSPVSVAPRAPSTDNVSPHIKLPGAPDAKPGAGTNANASKADANVSKANVNGSQKQTPSDISAARSTNQQADPVGGKIPDVDELAKRFAALKK